MTIALLLMAVAVQTAAQDPPRFSDRVDVARVLIDVRAIDPRGRPLRGLGPADFEVKIGGRVARIESVQHVSGGSDPAESGAASSARTAHPPAPHDRLVVFLFQKNLDRSRIVGLLRSLRELARSLDTLPPRDRAAVLRFDSRLHLLLDFTRDRERLRRVILHDVLYGDGLDTGEAREPSLRQVLDKESDAPSYSIERSLRRIAEALTTLPGAKSVVVVGHGFGRVSSTGVALDSDYDHAKEALQRARASVFCLDVTDADYHSLETGLQTAAADTGGLYQRTHIFSQAALDRVLAALDGQYVLFVEKPDIRPGAHRLDVRLKGRDGVVLAPASLAN